MNSKIIGIDLSGYLMKKTAVVSLEISGEEAIFELIKHPFNDFEPTLDLISSQIEKEILFLNQISRVGQNHIVIDAPIDLSQMPLGILTEDYSLISGYGLTKEINEVWRLRMRPIDKVFNGLSPLFSLLGIITQRARLALSKSYASETYPKISRRLMGYAQWDSANPLENFETFLSTKGVSLVAHTDAINDDEFDAIWCALAGLQTIDVVTNHYQALENKIYADMAEGYREIPWPKDYRLIVSWPQYIRTVVIKRETPINA